LATDAKSNEITAIPKLLKLLDRPVSGSPKSGVWGFPKNLFLFPPFFPNASLFFNRSPLLILFSNLAADSHY